MKKFNHGSSQQIPVQFTNIFFQNFSFFPIENYLFLKFEGSIIFFHNNFSQFHEYNSILLVHFSQLRACGMFFYEKFKTE